MFVTQHSIYTYIYLYINLLMGTSTTKWGPAAWDMLFNIALNVDLTKDHTKDAASIRFFNGLGLMLPCQYCVDYYAIILKQMPIENVIGASRKKDDPYACFRWLYLVKNKVNEKLIRQETQCLLTHFLTIKDELVLKGWADKLLFTKATPSFQQVLQKYMANRTDCSRQLNQDLKSCRHIPL